MPKLRNTVEWFPHIASASQSATVCVLEKRYQNNGYAGWFKLLECLCLTENHVLCLVNPVRQEILADRLGLDKTDIMPFLDLCASLDAIDAELWAEHIVWCQNLVDRIAQVYTDSRKRQPPSRPTPHLHPITEESRQITTESSVGTEEPTHKPTATPIDLPEYVDRELWDGFVENRKKTKHAMTDLAKQLTVKNLVKLHDLGIDPNERLTECISRGWQGVIFDSDKVSGNGSRPNSRAVASDAELDAWNK